MFRQFRRNLWATRVFFLTRFVVCAAVSFVYILIAAGIQYLFVKWFGENTFNYIIGGILSIIVGAWICNYIGYVAFVFVRGWHMAALAKTSTILKKKYPALDVGMRVFSKHFSSFAVVYGVGAMIKHFASEGVDSLWKLLDDVPYVGSLQSVTEFPFVKHMASDILDTGFDACIYYLVKYTKAGISDDIAAIPEAMKRYLYALPSVMCASLSHYVLLYCIPKVVKFITVVGIVFSQGLVAGILINVLMFPVFYFVRHSLLDPLKIIIMVSCYSQYCTEEPAEEDSKIKKFVDAILVGLGIDNPDEEESEESVEGSEEPATVTSNAGSDELEIDAEPEFEEEGSSEDLEAIRSLSNNLMSYSSTFTVDSGDDDDSDNSELNDLLRRFNSSSSALSDAMRERKFDEDTKDLHIPLPGDESFGVKETESVDTLSPVEKITRFMGGVNPNDLNRILNESYDEDDVNPLSGEDVEFD